MLLRWSFEIWLCINATKMPRLRRWARTTPLSSGRPFHPFSFCLLPLNYNAFLWMFWCAAATKPLNSGCGWCGLL
jgi:hypothetical protein